MINEPNNISSGCEAHGELLAYLYGELGAGRASAFRAHLDACAECGAEFSAFTALRGSIGDWKSAFDRLETPLIRLPLSERIVKAAPRSEPSFLESVRAFLAGFPALAAGSLAVLAVVGGIALYLLSAGTPDEIARDNGNRVPTGATPAPTVPPSVVTAAPKRTEPETAARPKDDPKPIKIADRPANRTRTETRKIAGNERNKPRGTNPTLSGEDDAEDDTIRLADLFDEIGTE